MSDRTAYEYIPDFKTSEQVPESWLDRCTDNGYERFTDNEGNRRYVDNEELVSDMPFRPCARCGHYPTEDGDDWCIRRLGRVVNACCGHGTHDGYVMFDDCTIIRGRFEVERPEKPLPMTNFDRITESPQVLAHEIIQIKENIIDTVAHIFGIETAKQLGRTYEHITEQRYLEWLQEECDE